MFFKQRRATLWVVERAGSFWYRFMDRTYKSVVDQYIYGEQEPISSDLARWDAARLVAYRHQWYKSLKSGTSNLEGFIILTEQCMRLDSILRSADSGDWTLMKQYLQDEARLHYDAAATAIDLDEEAQIEALEGDVFIRLANSLGVQ